jgi:hypothetical protein
MKTYFEAEIGDSGLRLKVMEHGDAAGVFVIDVMRHGISETTINDALELQLLGEAIRLAGIQGQN